MHKVSVGVCLFLAVAAPAFGAERLEHVAVLDLEAAGVPAEVAQAASVLVPTEVRARLPGAQVLGSAEIRTMLGFERQRQLLNCSDGECMAELGGALGADELVSGRLARLGTTLVLELRRTDLHHARVLASVTRTTATEEGLVGTVREAIAALYPAARPPATAAAPGVATAAPGRKIGAMPIVSTVSGAVLAGAGTFGVLYALGVDSRYRAQQPGGTSFGNPTVTRAEASRAQVIYPAGWAVGAAGVALLGYGIFGIVRGEPAASQVAFVPLERGGAVAFGGVLP